MLNKTCTDGRDKGNQKYSKLGYIEWGNISEKLKFENTNSEEKNAITSRENYVFLKQKNVHTILHIACLSVVEAEEW